MAGSLNKVMLIGNLGKDPEVKYLESGVAVAKFSIATTETYKDRNTGERISQTEWHNITLWRGLAEVAEKYLKKGNQVYIEGKLKTRSWQDEAGNKRYATDIVGDQMTMLGSKNDNPNAAPITPVSSIPQAPPVASVKPTEDPIDDLPF